MIDPIALIALKSNAVVTRPYGDTKASCVAVHDFGRADARTLRARTDNGDVYLRRADIDHMVDLRTAEYLPRKLEFFRN